MVRNRTLTVPVLLSTIRFGREIHGEGVSIFGLINLRRFEHTSYQLPRLEALQNSSCDYFLRCALGRGIAAMMPILSGASSSIFAILGLRCFGVM